MENEKNKFPLKVLIAEDDLPSQIFIQSLLRYIFEHVVVASDGAEALTLFKKESPDLVVTDIGMPFINGLELSRQIKESNPNIPIILTTAFDNKSVLIDAIEIGISHYIFKPIIKEQIINVLEKVAISILFEKEFKKQQEQVRLLHSAIEHTNGIVMIFDSKGLITYVNNSFLSLTDYYRDEVYGKKYEMFVSDYFSEYLNFSINIKNLEKWQGESKIKKKDGQEFFVYMSVSPIYEIGGDYNGFVVVADDVTDKKLAEEQMKRHNELLEEKVLERTAELNDINQTLKEEIEIRKKTESELIKAKEIAEEAYRAKSLFLAKVSHELRTPMNGILGMTSVLLDTDIDERQRRSLNIVKHSGESLLNVINDILDWSKIDAGKLSLDLYPFRLRVILNQTYDLLYSISASKGLDLRFHINNDVPDALIGDANRLHQVLVNLIGNSIKFTEEGFIEVAVQKGPTEGDVIMLDFSVRDTGIGIESEMLGRLFQSFSQIDNNLTRKYGGTGLGLAISKEIIEMMDGNIDCQSQKEVGSVFHFTAKFRLHNELLPQANSLDNEFGKYSDEYPDFYLKVLVAEDSLINQEVIKEALDKKKCTYKAATNGNEAFNAFKKGKYDLVFMDLQMPIWDGFKATEEIIKYELDNKLDHTPIIALTAHDDQDSRNKCKDVGMDDFLTKPFKWDEIYKILNKFNKKSDRAIVDIDALLSSINQNNELLIRIMRYFVDNISKELDDFSTAINSSDFDNTFRIAHKLKSEIGNFNAPKIVGLLRKIEIDSKNKNINNILSIYPSIEFEVNLLKKYFVEYINNQKNKS